MENFTVTDPITGTFSSQMKSSGVTIPKYQGPTQTPTPVAPVSPTKQPTKNTFSVNLTDAQKALIKKNNPEFFSSRPDVFATDLTTEKVDVPTSEAGTSPLDSSLTNVPAPTDVTTDTTGTTTGTTDKTGTTTGNTTEQLSPRDQALQALMGTFQDQQAFDPTAIKEAEGVYQRQALVNQLSESYDKAIVNQRRTIQDMRQNPEGKLRGALNADIENYKYESDQNLADKAMQLHYANQDYQSALTIANDAIQAQTDKFDQQMSFFSNMYTLLGNDMTDSEKMMFQSQLSQQEYAFKNLQDAKSQAMQSAGANGAPPEVLSAIKNSQTMEDVWANAGSYGIDPNLSLARDKFYFEKQLALTKLSMEQALKAGDISAETAQKAIAKAEGDKKFAYMEEEINNILMNETGLNVATGKIKGAFKSALFDFTGAGGYFPNKLAQEDLANSMEYVSRNLTTQALADAKAQGITFGALSERELDVLGGSADVLSSAWDSETMTFRGSPAKIEQSLKDLRKVTVEKRAVNELGQEKVNETKQVWNQL